jgi:hypothetical protein
MAQILILSRGHSLSGCFSLHLGQKNERSYFSSSCFFLNCKVSNCKLRVPRISVLKFSSKFPNSTLVTPLVADLVTLERVSLGPL